MGGIAKKKNIIIIMKRYFLSFYGIKRPIIGLKWPSQKNVKPQNPGVPIEHTSADSRPGDIDKYRDTKGDYLTFPALVEIRMELIFHSILA